MQQLGNTQTKVYCFKTHNINIKVYIVTTYFWPFVSKNTKKPTRFFVLFKLYYTFDLDFTKAAEVAENAD